MARLMPVCGVDRLAPTPTRTTDRSRYDLRLTSGRTTNKRSPAILASLPRRSAAGSAAAQQTESDPCCKDLAHTTRDDSTSPRISAALRGDKRRVYAIAASAEPDKAKLLPA
jgi:hypothetical protein